MIEILKRATLADFSQRYHNSYGWCDIEGKRTLVCIDEVHSNRVGVVHDGGYTEIPCDVGFKFEFTPTARGWYNTDDIAHPVVLITRNPQRQWSRGINRNNTNVLNQQLRPLGVNLGLLNRVHWDRWDRTASPKQPVALSRQFMLHSNNSLYFYNRPVGVQDKGVLHAKELVVQEVKDMVNRSKLPYKVEQL